MDFKQFYNQNIIEPDIYFKFVCFYNAKTELYDRTLTDMRGPHDNTEAYIVGQNRVYSNCFAKRLYDWTVNYIRFYTNQSFSKERWNRSQKSFHYSAQGWIDMFNYLKKENDKIIIDIVKSWEEKYEISEKAVL